MHLFAPDLVPDDVFTLRNDRDFSCPRKAKNFKKKIFRPAPMEMTSGEGRALAGRRASGPRRRVGPRPVIFFPRCIFLRRISCPTLCLRLEATKTFPAQGKRKTLNFFFSARSDGNDIGTGDGACRQAGIAPLPAIPSTSRCVARAARCSRPPLVKAAARRPTVLFSNE